MEEKYASEVKYEITHIILTKLGKIIDEEENGPVRTGRMRVLNDILDEIKEVKC